MPSFVPKEQETDMAYVPGTIQYRRRLEQERSAKLAAVGKSAVSVDKAVDNSPTPPPLLSDQIVSGDGLSLDTQPSGIEPVASSDELASPYHSSLGDNLSCDTQPSSDVYPLGNVDSSGSASLSSDVNLSPVAQSSVVVESLSVPEASPIVIQPPSPTLPDTASLQLQPSPVSFVSHDQLASHDERSSVAVSSPDVQPLPKPKRSLSPDLPRLVRLQAKPTLTPTASPVHIYKNFAFRDRDLAKYMREMTGDEWKVYCYLLSVTHEKWEGETHCWTSQHVIKEETGVGSKRTVGLVLESLEAKGFVERTFKGNRVIKMSQYRVFLPCEREGYAGKTKIAYERRSNE